MSIYFQASASQGFAVRLSTTAATVVAGDADRVTVVDWFQATEYAGGTAALTIDIYDGTTAIYLRNAKALTAKEEVLRTQGITLQKGQYLRFTASIANNVDVTGVQVQKSH